MGILVNSGVVIHANSASSFTLVTDIDLLSSNPISANPFQYSFPERIPTAPIVGIEYTIGTLTEYTVPTLNADVLGTVPSLAEEHYYLNAELQFTETFGLSATQLGTIPGIVQSHFYSRSDIIEDEGHNITFPIRVLPDVQIETSVETI